MGAWITHDATKLMTYHRIEHESPREGRSDVKSGPTMMLAQSFNEEFKNWFSDGATSSILYFVIVMVVVAVVVAMSGRSSR